MAASSESTKAPHGFDAKALSTPVAASSARVLSTCRHGCANRGYEYRATLESEMAAAAAGGVNQPRLPARQPTRRSIEPGLGRDVKHRARLPDFAHVYPVGALTVKLAGERPHRNGRACRSRCVAFGQATPSSSTPRCCGAPCSTRRPSAFPVWLQAQDPFLARDGVAHDGEVATRLGLTGIPVAAETIALATILATGAGNRRAGAI